MRFASALCLTGFLAAGVAYAQDVSDGDTAGGATADAGTAGLAGPDAGFDPASDFGATAGEGVSTRVLPPLPGARAAAAASPAPADPAPDDDGVIGLIEAPQGLAGFAADLMPPELSVDQFSSPEIIGFAESQPQPSARVLGPIDHPPVVVELFTAQGCSSCPPADEMLGELTERDDVLALSWHVDYWDYLGWADQFARPEFTRRQQAYAHTAGERAIYTPQMIVGGTDTLISVRPADLMALVQTQMARPPQVMVSSSQKDGAYRIDLTPRAAIRNPVVITLVRYAPDRAVTIKSGENRGLTVEYRNVVLDEERIADWDGRAPLRLSVKPDTASGDAFPADTRHALLAQELGRGHDEPTGPILAAIRLD